MQYLLKDLMKLPLQDRLVIIEKMLNASSFKEADLHFRDITIKASWYAAITEVLADKHN
jgi:hypothetical protein